MQGELFGVWWVWWLLGTVGIGGTVALAIFMPAALELVVVVIRKMLGTRIGVGLIVAAVVFVGADIHRSRLDQRVLEQQKAAFERKQKERDDKIAEDTKAAVDAALAERKASDTAVDQAVKDFQNALAPAPATGNPFAVGPDACKLRRIAGLACREPQGPKRVPSSRQRRNPTPNH